MIDINEQSRVVRVDGETKLIELQRALASRGLTLGLLTDCIDTVGSRLARPRALDRSPRYGRWVDACIGLEVKGHDGRVLCIQPVPRKAAGPDWRGLLSGAELVTVLAAVLRVHGRPERQVGISWRFASRTRALEMARGAVRLDVTPATWGITGSGPAVLSGRLEGPAAIVAAEQAVLSRLSDELGGQAASAAELPSTQPSSFLPWSEVMTAKGAAFEMCVDGACVIGHPVAPATHPFSVSL